MQKRPSCEAETFPLGAISFERLLSYRSAILGRIFKTGVGLPCINGSYCLNPARFCRLIPLQHRPLKSHQGNEPTHDTALQKVVRYLKGSKRLDLEYDPGSHLESSDEKLLGYTEYR